MFDVIVVGKGLFGSSAIRYLSQLAEKVAIIGPDEPQNPATHPGVFGAHYDEGRITYQLKADPVWARLAVDSLVRLPEIEKTAEISFYTPAGHLYVADKKMDNGHFESYKKAKQNGAEFAEWLNGLEIRERFPYLRVASDSPGVWEERPAGYLSPRGLIQAQLALSKGVKIISDMVIGIEVEQTGVLVNSARGDTYRARKVLIAAGAYSNGFGLLERPLDLRLKHEYVIRAALPHNEVDRLKGMPTVVYRINHPRLSELYILPPIRYPDGRYHLKMGANTVLDAFVEGVEAINDWYRTGNSDALLPEMRDMVLNLFPGLLADSWETHRCVITRTAHGRPYIDAVTPGRVYVAVGGNGQGAKAADEIGRLAAHLVIEGQSPGEAFAAVFQG